MKLNVEVYIKKNILVNSGTITSNNTSPYDKLYVDITMTTDQYIGFYVVITSGINANSISWINGNATSTLTIVTGIVTQAGDTFEIYGSSYERLDLFKDEKISITSQIGNANDIGKLYTDYTQSFTIPASKNNNQILSHWYESSVDNGFDHRMRYDAFIEINTHRFRDGTIQLEKADKKNGFVESYSVTFYGNLAQLKDVFKDDKLQTLDYSSLNHTYNSTEIRARISALASDNAVKYPLIGNANKYSYQNGTSTDITTTTGAIRWNDLFPAISLVSIFTFLQAKYGVTFIGTFFNLDQWKKLNLYLKPSLAMSFLSEPLNFNFTSKSSSFPELNLTTDILTTNFNYGAFMRYFTIDMEITPQATFLTTPYVLYVYRNGILYKTFNGLGVQIFECGKVNQTAANATTQYKYTFKLSAAGSFSFIGKLYYTKTIYDTSTNVITDIILNGLTSVQSVSANIQIGNYIPDIKIIDFLTGIIKAFNLMIVPKPNNTYEFLPLEMYYNAGKILDITEYVYENEISVNKPKLFKSINFTYETSKNVLNEAYKGIYQQSYGDLIYNSTRVTESSSYDIKLPFENVLFELVKVGKQFQTATLIDKDLKPYIPKPMLIYCNGTVTPLTGTDRIYTTNSSGVQTQITNYVRFSNEYDSMPTDLTHSHLMTMNFGNEQSSWLGELAPQGLYFRHYENFIENLYDIKTRLISVKALLPASLLGSTVTNSAGIPLGIALNDRLVIRNKRYLINSFTTDLTTGEASFELLTDYRGVNAINTVGYRFASMENIQTNKDALVFNLVLYLNDSDKFDIKASTSFLSYTVTTNNTTDVTLTVTIPVNSTGIDRNGAIGLDYYANGSIYKTQYIIVTQTGI